MENQNSEQREEKTTESQQKLPKIFSYDVVRDRKIDCDTAIPNMVYDISDPIICDMSLWRNDLSNHVSLPPLSVQGDKPIYKSFVKKEEERKIGLQLKDKSGCCNIL